MFDELKNLLRDALKAIRARIEPVEDDVEKLKAEVADLKAFRDELKGAGFGDLKADLDALGGKAAAPAPKTKPDAPAEADKPAEQPVIA